MRRSLLVRSLIATAIASALALPAAATVQENPLGMRVVATATTVPTVVAAVDAKAKASTKAKSTKKAKKAKAKAELGVKKPA